MSKAQLPAGSGEGTPPPGALHALSLLATLPVALPASRRLLAALMAVVALGQAGLVTLGLHLGTSPFLVSPVWPAAGFALAAVYALGFRMLPALFVGQVAANLLTGNPFPIGIGKALAALLGPAVGAYLLRRYVRIGKPDTGNSDMARFLGIGGLLVPASNALLGTLALWTLGGLPPETLARTFLTWWSGDAVGILTVTPFLFVWLVPGRRRLLFEQPVEAAALLGLTAVTSAIAFWHEAVTGVAALHPEYLVWPFLLWTTVRLGLFGAANGNLLVAAAAITASLQGFGPYGAGLPVSLASLEGMVLLTSVTTLLLGVAVSRTEMALREARQAADLRRSLEEFRDLMEQPGVGLMVLDQTGAIQYTNATAASLMNRAPEDLVGEPLGIPVIGHASTEIGIRRPNGQPGEADITVNPVRWGGQAFYLVTFHDVTERNRAERAVRRQALRDGLTGLANREHFREQVTGKIQQMAGDGEGFALLFLDLDRFKEINDTLGHTAGDELLRVLAQRLTENVREQDLVARMSGDEFIALLHGVGDRDTATAVATKLHQRLFQPVRLGNQVVSPTGTIGLSLFPEDGRDFETLYRQADIAMYAGKEAGRDCIHPYRPEQEANTSRRFELEQALRQAQVNQEFRLLYQPQYALTDGRLIGVEALLRWDRPGEGMVSPGDFMPMLEETGLIIEVGEWVIRQAARDMRAWEAAWAIQGTEVPRIWINVAARQLEQADFAARAAQVIAEEGVAPERLGLELTETGVSRDLELSRKAMAALKERGFQLAMDDFGTGFSSLGFLKELPFDVVKVDKSFVQTAPERPADHQLVRTIIAMAHGLELTALAEGVESDTHLQLLRAEGCDAVQGFLFARPLPASEITTTPIRVTAQGTA